MNRTHGMGGRVGRDPGRRDPGPGDATLGHRCPAPVPVPKGTRERNKSICSIMVGLMEAMGDIGYNIAE